MPFRSTSRFRFNQLRWYNRVRGSSTHNIPVWNSSSVAPLDFHLRYINNAQFRYSTRNMSRGGMVLPQIHQSEADTAAIPKCLTLGSHIFDLTPGTKLGYNISGNPTGEPVFYFHGTPSSRLEGDDWHALAMKLNICIICIDRPGLGLSTFRGRNYTLLDWPQDVLQLANHLGFEQFRVIGGSGGGPYALACAHELSPGRLKATGVLAGMGPPEAGFWGAAWDRWFAFYFNKWVPWSLLRFAIEKAVGEAARNPDQTWFRRIVKEGMIDTLPAKDRALFDEFETERMIIGIREAAVQGSDGYVLDSKNIFKKWPFELKNVEAKVRLWYGTDDHSTPIHMARWMAGQLKNASLREFPDDTHDSMFIKRGEEVFKELLEM